MALDLRRNRYAPTPERAVRLHESLRTHVPQSRGRIAMIELDGDDPTSDLCRVLEQSVFDEAFGSVVPHTPELMTAEYGPYESSSYFFVAVDVSTMTLAGTLRVIKGFPNKTVTDLKAARLTDVESLRTNYDFVPAATWDIGSVAVDKEFRRTLRTTPVSIPLYRALYLAALRHNIREWTSVIDIDVLAFYQRLGIPFERLAGLDDLNYLGSTATACYLNVANIRRSMDAASVGAPRRLQSAISMILHGEQPIPDEHGTRVGSRARQQIELPRPSESSSKRS